MFEAFLPMSWGGGGGGSKFFPFEVDPMSKSHIIQWSKLDFMQVNYMTLFSDKMQAAFISAGVFIRIHMVTQA